MPREMSCDMRKEGEGMIGRILAVCDTEPEYAERLAQFIGKRESFPLEVSAFREQDNLIRSVNQGKVEMVLGSCDVIERIHEQCKGQEPVLVLIDDGSRDVECHEKVWKYQSGVVIRREIIRVLEEAGSLRISNRSVAAGIIGIFSPYSQAGVDDMVLRLGQELVKSGTVLYMNFVPFTGLNTTINAGGEGDMSDILYYLDSKDKLVCCLERLVSCCGNVDIVPAVTNYEDLGNVKGDVYRELIGRIGRETSYRYVLINLSYQMQEVTELMKMCSVVLFPYGMAYGKSYEEFEAYLKRYECRDLIQLRCVDVTGLMQSAEQGEVPGLSSIHEIAAMIAE